MDMSALRTVIDRQQPGWSLEQPFYLDHSIHEFEREAWMTRQWMLVAHDSEVPVKGSHIVRELFDESIIVVRSGEGDDGVRAYFNVCTHRGSRLCKDDGKTPLFVCPYHAWSFKLTGELQSRRDVPEGVDPSTLGLHPVPLHMVEGLIFCALPGPDLPDPRPACARLAPALRRHGTGRARILARKSYPTNANWKLVVENAFECYHCTNAHPEYSSVNGHVQLTGMRDPARGEAWSAQQAQWEAGVDADDPSWLTVREPGSLDVMTHSVTHGPIGSDHQTLSRGGAPVAPPMGEFTTHDGSTSSFRLGRLSFAVAASDHVTLIQIQPRGPQQTDMVLTWLVDADADPDLAVDPVQWMWDVTTIQDKRIIEDNAAGVRSCAYRPAPYTALESGTAEFVATYLGEMRALLDARQVESAAVA